MANGLAAFQNASKLMDRAGDQIRKASVEGMNGEPKTDLSGSLVELQQASINAKAAVKVMEAEKTTSDYLLDVLA
ncbi:MAG: hypothetical protein FIA97_16880 [Methylococcaceae bacterium]|nr:hypothetical protein [Methylococcaceae bacterium]